MSYAPIKIFSNKEKKEFTEKLNSQFGISEINGILLQRGAERIFLFQGDLTTKQLQEIDDLKIHLERAGVYFAKIVNDEIRLSIEGVHLLQNQITKNIFELTDSQAEQWMSGEELLIPTGKKEFLVMKHKENFLGCGKASAEKISNYIPKNRRLKIKD